jgi:predicted transcriptional regulator
MADPSNTPRQRSCPRCGGTGTIMHDGFVGSQMRARREAIGISLRELSRRVKWSATYVSDLELGRKLWTDRKVQRYVKGLR